MSHTQDAVTQDRIDAEISFLRNTLVRLVTRRNTLSPLSRLPVEIISTIIRMHHDSAVAEDDTSYFWIKVSHVSRQWREIAINIPHLWTRIDFQYPLWVKEMLKRSQNLGLTISVNPCRGSHATWDAKLRTIRVFIKHNMTRIREIDIRGFSKDINLALDIIFQPIKGPFTKNAPELRVLRLPELSQNHVDPVPILERFFVHANNLKVIDISCAKNWDSKLFTNLTHLKVQNPQSFSRPTQVQFFSALRRMPLLESLDLRGPILPPLPIRSNTLGCGHVMLSELQSLAIVDEASVIPNFMKAVSFPAATTVNIGCNVPSNQLSHISTVIAHLPSQYSSSNSLVRGLRLDMSRTLTKLVNHYRFSLQVDLETWYDVPSAAALELNRSVNPFNGPPFLALSMSWLPPSADIEALESRVAIAHFGVAVPFRNLSVLSLTSSDISEELPKIDDALFTEVLGTQPELHTVFVTGSILQALFRNLEPYEMHPSALPDSGNFDDGNQVAVSKPRTLFPEMRHLSISDYDFSEGASDLLDCLFARHTYGYRLEILSIRNCTGLKNKVLKEMLEGVVTSIVVLDSWFSSSSNTPVNSP